MRIAELFHSIQGEGMLIGTPSVFVRTSGCNLRCTWCDTPYTSWAPEGTDVALEEIVAFARRHTRGAAGHTVVTGGEPMIAPDIVPLTQALREAGQHITVETAGTVFAPVVCDLMSISPKLANSTPLERDSGRWAAGHDRLRIQPEVLRRLVGDYDYQLKFVVVSEGDLPEIRDIVVRCGAAPDRVVLMPEGTDADTLRARRAWLVEACLREGWRFSPRLQIELWGNLRGR